MKARALAHPVIQAKSIFVLDSVSVWYRSGNSFPENRIWRTHTQVSGIQATSMFALGSVSVQYRSGNSYPENRIWRTYKQSWELPLRNPSNINLTLYLYRFDIGLTLQSKSESFHPGIQATPVFFCMLNRFDTGLKPPYRKQNLS